MLKLKPNLLQQLKCIRCDGYLDVAPIMITSDKCQICGKCYKILPAEEKSNCVRQIAYEVVAEMLLFPCRYNVHGCQVQFSFNEADIHEPECSFRFDASYFQEDLEAVYEEVLFSDHKCYVNDSDGSLNGVHHDKYNPINFTVTDTSQNVIVQSTFILKENNATKLPSVIKYTTSIFGNDQNGSALLLTNCKFNHFIKNPIKIIIEGAIGAENFHNMFCNVTVSSIERLTDNFSHWSQLPITSSKSVPNLPKCVKCYGIVKNEIYHCTFGHDVCNTCKGSKCVICTSPINLVPRYHCENFSKGCPVYLIHTDLYLHSKECEFATYMCPFEGQCVEVCTTLFFLKGHLIEKHAVITSNSVNRQSSATDEFWIMVIFENIFKCKYFCYGTHVEMLVELVGSHKNAEKYKYEIRIRAEGSETSKIVRSAQCVKWQASALDECVLITEKDFKGVKLNMQKFFYTVTIIEINR